MLFISKGGALSGAISSTQPVFSTQLTRGAGGVSFNKWVSTENQCNFVFTIFHSNRRHRHVKEHKVLALYIVTS